MDNSDIILTLSPADEFGLAADAFRLQHNRDRYLKPSAFVDDAPSREITPLDTDFDGVSNDSLEYFHRILLDFRQGSKVPGRYIFGSDPKLCDVLLTSKRGQYNISGQHFHISFDDQQRLILEDVSTNGTTVIYDDQAKNQRRRHFRWILFDEYRSITVTLQQKAELKGLALHIHLPYRSPACVKKYREKVLKFMADAQDAMPALDHLALLSHGSSIAPSETLSPRQRPIYIEAAELGKGASGRVCKVVNVSTGLEYAGKEFFHEDTWLKEVEIMRGLHHV